MQRFTMRRLILLAFLVVLLIALLVFGAVLGWWKAVEQTIGLWFRGILSGVVIAGVLAVGCAVFLIVREAIAQYRAKLILGRRPPASPTPPGSPEEASDRQLDSKLAEALRIIEQAPRDSNVHVLYAVPWYLLLGAKDSGKTALLRGVATALPPFAVAATATTGPTENCDWWFFPTATILDTTGAYAFPSAQGPVAAQWTRFLQRLREARPRLPLNGVVLTVAAENFFVKAPAELSQDAMVLRQRLDELIRTLGVSVPVYLVVTRCDSLEGFREFFACFPAATRQQVFGYVHEALPVSQRRGTVEDAPLRFAPIAEMFVTRLQQLRLTIFHEEQLPPENIRAGIFCFPEEFSALQTPLSAFVEALVTPNPLQYSPMVRGLFFTSARQEGPRYSFLRRELRFPEAHPLVEEDTTAYFLHDLIAYILPRDQHLARPTPGAVTARRIGRLLRSVICLVGVLLIGWALRHAYTSDRGNVAAVDPSVCRVVSTAQEQAPLLESTERCRQEVQALHTRNHERAAWSALLFYKGETVEQELRQRYVEKFTHDVLRPLLARLDERLHAGTDTVPLIFFLIKRLEILQPCLTSASCPASVIMDLQSDYPHVLASTTPAQVSLLHHTDTAYLQWAAQSGDVLHQEHQAHAERLRRWFAAKQVALNQILPWANTQYAAVTARQYWEPIPSIDTTKVQVDGAYTPDAWQQRIFPFVHRASAAVPDMATELQAFQQAYFAQYFVQWQRLLLDFPRAEPARREDRRALAALLVTERSPYQRVLDSVVTHLRPLFPTTGVAPVIPPVLTTWGDAVWTLLWPWRSTQRLGGPPAVQPPHAGTAVPAWAHLLTRYMTSDSHTTYLNTLKELRDALATHAPTDTSFRLVQTAFQEGKPTAQSAQPVFKALWTAQQFFDAERVADEDSKVVRPLLERPVSFVWKVLLDGARDFLDKAWETQVLTPTKNLGELDRMTMLYGPQGKVREFVEQSMKPFLVESETRAGTVLGEAFPLSPGFLKMLQEEKQLHLLLKVGKYPVRVEAGGPTSLVSHLPGPVVEERTELRVECGGKLFTISNRGDAGTATIVWEPKSCGDVVLTVFLPCLQSCATGADAASGTRPEALALPMLTKRYAGHGGFVSFLRDFRHPVHDFGVNDFTDADALPQGRPPSEVMRQYRLSKIAISYRITLPPELEQLLSSLATVKLPPTPFK